MFKFHKWTVIFIQTLCDDGWEANIVKFPAHIIECENLELKYYSINSEWIITTAVELGVVEIEFIH